MTAALDQPKTCYRFSRVVANLLQFIGLLLVVMAFFVFGFRILGLASVPDSPFSDLVGFFAAQAGLASGFLLIKGVLILALGQGIKALLDTADHTRLIMHYLAEHDR